MEDEFDIISCSALFASSLFFIYAHTVILVFSVGYANSLVDGGIVPFDVVFLFFLLLVIQTWFEGSLVLNLERLIHFFIILNSLIGWEERRGKFTNLKCAK